MCRLRFNLHESKNNKIQNLIKTAQTVKHREIIKLIHHELRELRQSVGNFRGN